jgi:hypothetical protein
VGSDISLQQSKPLKGFTDGPLRVRFSLSGGKQLDHRGAELNWEAEEMTKKRKDPHNELRVQLG